MLDEVWTWTFPEFRNYSSTPRHKKKKHKWKGVLQSSSSLFCMPWCSCLFVADTKLITLQISHFTVSNYLSLYFVKYLPY
jgi:hypothetical protein